MIIISFQNGTDWYKANWIFRQFAQDLLEQFPDDVNLKLLMEQAEALGGVSLDSVNEDIAAEALIAMKTVAEETIRGKIQGWRRTKPDDEKGQQMYIKSITELLDAINKQVGSSL